MYTPKIETLNNIIDFIKTNNLNIRRILFIDKKTIIINYGEEDSEQDYEEEITFFN